MKTLDIGQVLSYDDLVALRDQGGHQAVAPYLDPFNAKGCTRQYLEDIYRAGLKLAGFFYETTGGSGQGDSYFTEAQGAQDARFAEQLLASFKGLVPDGVRVWYADDVRLASVTSFDAYANGIERNATPAQTPGIYGFEDLLRHAQDEYPHMGKRLFLTYGDPRGLSLDGWQHEQVTTAGITVDVSDVYVPGWAPQEEGMTAQETYDLIAPLLQQNIVAPQHDTNTWLKEYTNAVKAGDAAAIAAAETKIGVALEHAAKAFGESAALIEADSATAPQ